MNINEDNELNNYQIMYVTPVEAYTLMESSMDGLSEEQVSHRLKKYGKNEISKKKQSSMFKKLISNFTSLMALLLWGGGLLAILSGTVELGISIFCVNLINGFFSFFQEFKAEKATSALQKMMPSYARVVRDGKEVKIFAEDIVPGDIMILEEGDRICGDARILRCSDFQVDQSTLTGESNPIRKNYEALQEKVSYLEAENMIFTGTTVASGTCHCVVVATGMDSEFGKIANLTQNTEKSLSPLQKELNVLTKQIAIIALSVGIVFMLIAVFVIKDPLLESFIFSLGMIVAFIPEGLLPAVTLSLALSVQRMAKDNALVKKLSAVETLGCTNVICSDKTGTLTQNEMTVNHLWTLDSQMDVSGEGYVPNGKIYVDEQEITAKKSNVLRLLLSGAVLCSNAKLVPPQNKSVNPRYTVLGDPTEACLEVVAKKAEIDLDKLNSQYPRILELPFESRRKRMTTIHQLKDSFEGNQRIAFVKGSPKEVMELCNRCFKGSKACPISEEDRINIDYGLTAESIARKIGIIKSDTAQIVSGTELSKMNDQELKNVLEGEVVFARMAPDQKYRIVCALQEMGNIVAVTGDGVNDSPALKKADIGVAMGITGTDVAKEAADMILTDDNFASIVRAIEEGRAVYNNIRKFLRYIFDSNTPEAAAPALYLLSGGLVPMPLTIMQILTIDIGTDMIPALGLGAEHPEDNIMNQPPRRIDERLLNKKVILVGFIWYGLIITLFALGGYFLVNYLNGWPHNPLAPEGTALYNEATTMMLVGVVFSQMGMVMNNRTEKESVFKRGIFSNHYINLGLVVEFVILLAVVYIPFLNGIFNTAPIGLIEWLYALPIPFIVFGIEELRKKILRNKDK